MAADEKALGALHTKLAEVLGELLDGQVLPAEVDEESGEVINEASKIPPSASVLTVVAKFLKDNNVTCAPSKDNAMGALADKLAKQKEEADARRKAMMAKMQPGKEDFMEGLPN